MNESINLVIALHDVSGDYSRHAGAMLTSVFDNTTSRVVVYILCDETMTALNHERFERLAQKYGQEIQFVRMTQDFSVLSEGVKSIEWVSQATLYRLLLPDVLPVEKVIYLDSDIIICGDIRTLWQESLSEKSIAAVPDVLVTRHQLMKMPFYQCVGIDINRYFNAGVLVMNLQQLRRRYNLAADTEKYIFEHKDTPLLDQDALNYVLGQDVQFLPEKYNTIWLDYDREDISDTIIWHYAGQYKVWNSIQNDQAKLYWRYLYQSPWGTIENMTHYLEIMQPELYPLEKLIPVQHYTSRKKLLLRIIQRVIYSLMKNI